MVKNINEKFCDAPLRRCVLQNAQIQQILTLKNHAHSTICKTYLCKILLCPATCVAITGNLPHQFANVNMLIFDIPQAKIKEINKIQKHQYST